MTNWIMPDVEDLRALWEIDLELAGSDQGPIPIITTVAEKTWVWSDLHLGDPSALQAFDRPFGDVDQISRHLLREWRRRVRSDDTIICLGDVAYPDAWRDQRLVLDIRDCPGKRVLVLGNHDLNRAALREVGFTTQCSLALCATAPPAGPEPLPATPDTGRRDQPSRTPLRKYRADRATHQPRGPADGLQPGRAHLGAGQGAAATARRTVDLRRIGERSATANCTIRAARTLPSVTTGPSQLTEWAVVGCRTRTPTLGHRRRASGGTDVAEGWRWWFDREVRPGVPSDSSRYGWSRDERRWSPACPRRQWRRLPFPPSGPRSTIQSPAAMASRLCSMTTTVLPPSMSRSTMPNRRSMSAG